MFRAVVPIKTYNGEMEITLQRLGTIFIFCLHGKEYHGSFSDLMYEALVFQGLGSPKFYSLTGLSGDKECKTVILGEAGFAVLQRSFKLYLNYLVSLSHSQPEIASDAFIAVDTETLEQVQMQFKGGIDELHCFGNMYEEVRYKVSLDSLIRFIGLNRDPVLEIYSNCLRRYIRIGFAVRDIFMDYLAEVTQEI